MYNSKTSALSNNATHMGDHELGGGLQSPTNSTRSDSSTFSTQITRSLLSQPAPLANPPSERILTRTLKAPVAPPQESKIRLRTATRHAVEARHFQPKQIEHLRSPFLSTNYSHSVLSWSCSDRLAVGLGEQIYIFDISTHRPDQLETPIKNGEVVEPVASLKFSPDGTHIAIGRTTRVEIYDVQSGKCLRRIKAHNQEIFDISWYNGTTFAIASADGTISFHDLAQRASLMTTFAGHRDSVLSCQWSLETSPHFLASGSLDNTVCIWDSRNLSTLTRPIMQYVDSLAATKAIAWCPFTDMNVLAAGGGSGDGVIRLYEVSNDLAKIGGNGGSSSGSNSLKPFESVETGSQITSLNFAIDDKELVTTHGFKNPREIIAETNNSVCTWRYPNLVRTSCVNNGFSDRVLFGTVSPLGSHMAFGEPIDNQSVAQQGSVYLYQMWESQEERQKRIAAAAGGMNGKPGMNKIGSKMR